jgi:hypothetical protein
MRKSAFSTTICTLVVLLSFYQICTAKNEYKIIPFDGATFDNFGCSVSISGDKCIVGAYMDDDKGGDSGSAYMFEFDGISWVQQAKLTASDGASSDWFGYSVSISGEKCIVGASGDDDKGSGSGSAYIFEFNGTSWIQQAKLTALDGDAGDHFGKSVSISGDRCVIGAYWDDDKGIYSGSVYIFEFNGTSWIQQAKITASDGAAFDCFGLSVSINSDRCIVGASTDDAGSYSGSAYIFGFNGTSWIQQAKLTASDGSEGDFFGGSVGFSGDRCIVGAHGDDDKGSDSGSAYIFEFDGISWIQKAKLTASDGAAGDCFGNSNSISGDRCIVGAYLDDDKGSGSGSAYIFKFNGTSWIQQAKLIASDGAEYDCFGGSVSISGDNCIVGADNDDYSGSAYIYNLYGALNPYPANGATDVRPNSVLSWSPGKDADSHDVYFGTGYSDVNDANTSSPEYKGNFDVNRFDSCSLELITTYYWRIDEVNEPNVWKGDVWSFETGGPMIALSDVQFEFYAVEGGESPANQILGISNGSGAGMLNWRINESCGWLSVEPNSGDSTGEVDNVNLSVDISGLVRDIYTCNLMVSDPNAFNNPQTVSITLYVGHILYVPSGYSTIQSAIDAAINGETVLVADGVYTGPGNRDIDFLGKAITVKSENGPKNCIIHCQSDANNPHRGLYFHGGETSNSVLDGFTITHGYVFDCGGPDYGGAGIFCSDSSPTIINCIITINHTELIPGCLGFCYGGGIKIWGSSSPTFTNCIISNNSTGMCGNGGGISISGSSNSKFTNCIIKNNSVAEAGTGGGVFDNAGATFLNCIISGNSANGVMSSCGGIACSGGVITNCIIRDNYNGQISGYLPTVTFSNIEGGYEGTGNIDADPCFANLSGDYHLKSQAGRWNPTSQSWVMDAVTSNCIDAGNPGCPLGDEPSDANNIRINIGAYGGTAEASKTPAGWRSIADLTNDWAVDFNDLGVFVSYWLDSGEYIPSDLNRNGNIDFDDYSIFAQQWPPNQAPTPVVWEVEPYETGGGLDAYANMTAVEAVDPEGNNPVEYYFECVDIPSLNSDWMTNRVWNDVYIGRAGLGLRFHFKIRDSLGRTSHWSSSLLCLPI